MKISTKAAIIATVSILANNSQIAYSQITPDNTLPTNSTVTPQGSVDEINGGSINGKNLYHSFAQFSVSPGRTAYFNNANTITNIIGRITGNDISSIYGVLKANGNANLFLFNPNGIVFGLGSSLNIGGSFLASTANSINFSDGFRFESKNYDNNSSLSGNSPISLSLGQSPGSITVNGNGHNLRSGVFTPVEGVGLSSNGLRVKSGKSILLIGGDINLNGGVITAPNGRIDLGSISNGDINLTPLDNFFTMDYSGASSFRNIILENRSLLDTSGLFSGSIQLQSGKILIKDGSVIVIQNQGSSTSGRINLVASDSVDISGTDPIAKIIGGLLTESLGRGAGGDISISSPKLHLINGASVSTRNYTLGNAGNIFINTPIYTIVDGFSTFSPDIVSNIISFSGLNSIGNSGNISINSKDIYVNNGGVIASLTRAKGTGGTVNINATNSVTLDGKSSNLKGSHISTATFSSGTAGDLNITTAQLQVLNGAYISNTTVNSGNGGNTTIKASNFILIQGGTEDFSFIDASARPGDPIFKRVYNLPDIPTGDAGNITIESPNVTVSNSGILVGNEGSGNAGEVNIVSKNITLNKGRISSTTQGGNGGLVKISTSNLIMIDGEIIASAKGKGNGGNISIQSKVLAGKNSFIRANAERGNGGEVSINTQGLIFDVNNISATSQKGTEFNGSVKIDSNTVSFQPQPELISKLLISDPITCSTGNRSRQRVITSSDLDLSDDQLETIALENNIPLFLDGAGKTVPLIEIQGWVPTGNGQSQTVAVIGNPSPSTSYIASGCKTLSLHE
jgi:filamentous hemagglutinin family protein